MDPFKFQKANPADKPKSRSTAKKSTKKTKKESK